MHRRGRHRPPATCADISGAGATFPFPIYAKWADASKKETGVGIAYRPVGSSEGIRLIQDKEVTFGASDMPLNAADLDEHGLVQFPTVVGGIVAVVNVEGIKSGDITLDGPTLARIFLGEIRSWNHAALRKLNPGAKLPSQPIVVVRRSDGSGTTFVFTDYLAKISQEWRSRIGSITSVEWPVGVGARGNEGVVGAVVLAHQGRDRLRRIRLRQAEQARLHHADQQGRQGDRAHHRLVRGRRRQRQLGRRSRLRRHPDQ